MRLQAGQAHFLHPTILGQLEKPLDASFRLRTVGRDPLDAQFLQGPAKLGLPVRIAPTRLLRLKNTVAVGVQTQRTTVLLQPLSQQVQVARQRFPGVKTSMDAAGGIVDHRNQHHRFASPFQPIVARRIHLHQLTEALPPRPALTMLVALALPLPQARCHQPTTQGIVRYRQTLFRQLLACQGRPKVRVTPLVLGQNFLPQFFLQPAIRRSPTQAVNQPLVA